MMILRVLFSLLVLLLVVVHQACAESKFSCPSVQLMQFEWKGTEKEALAAAELALKDVGFSIQKKTDTSLIGRLPDPLTHGMIYLGAKSGGNTNVVIMGVSLDSMTALSKAQALRTRMNKTPSPNREVAGTYTAIWEQPPDGEPSGMISRYESFQWNYPADQAGIAGERALREMGFENILGGGINLARAGYKTRDHLTVVIACAPINDKSAHVVLLATTTAKEKRAENYLRDIRSIIEYSYQGLDGEDKSAPPTASTKGYLTDAQKQDVDQAVASEIKNQHAVGVAIGVLQDNKVVYTQGYEYADREKNITVDTKTLFRWGSVSKTLTGVTALKLVEEGKISLDSDISQWVSTYPGSAQTPKPVILTPRELLCHQSGMPHYAPKDKVVGSSGYKFSGNEDVTQTVHRFDQSPLLFMPNQGFHYSSFGYMLLSAVLQQSSGKSFEKLVQDEIIGPIGAKTLQLEHYDPKNPLPHRATGYTKGKNPGDIVPLVSKNDAWKSGAGGYISNIEDLALWAQVLLQKKILSQGSYTMAWQQQHTATDENHNWGYGFSVDYEDNLLRISHDGLAQDGVAWLAIYPETHSGVVVLCNSVYVNPRTFGTVIRNALNQKK